VTVTRKDILIAQAQHHLAMIDQCACVEMLKQLAQLKEENTRRAERARNDRELGIRLNMVRRLDGMCEQLVQSIKESEQYVLPTHQEGNQGRCQGDSEVLQLQGYGSH